MRLQSRRQVGRLADDRPLARLPLADDIADHDRPGGDPHPGRQGLAARRLECRDRLGHVEAGPDRPLGLVPERLRPAEIGQHAVAHEFCDVTFVARNLAGDGLLVGANDVLHLLGIEP